jgi:predicted AAA+ superfamily ATPase
VPNLPIRLKSIDAIAETDISSVDGVKRDARKARALMRSYARFSAQQATIESIETDMLAWNPNLRSKTAIRTSTTRHFSDPSIATAALGLGPQALLEDLKTFGFLFESLCVRDLRTYAEALDGEVFHYRDKSGLECDAVLHLRDGSYGLIEVKLGGDALIEEGAKTLLALKNNIDTKKMKSPAFCMVLTAIAPYSFTRSDGVVVVPITLLKQ